MTLSSTWLASPSAWVTLPSMHCAWAWHLRNTGQALDYLAYCLHQEFNLLFGGLKLRVEFGLGIEGYEPS